MKTLIKETVIYQALDGKEFVDKNESDGSSDLYGISDFSTRTTDNIRKAYLLGKYGATPNIEVEEVD